MKTQYYAHGKFFDNERDFWIYCYEWENMPFDLEDFKRQMDLRIKEAEMNNAMRDGKMTNRQAYQILRLSTDWAVDKCIIQEVK